MVHARQQTSTAAHSEIATHRVGVSASLRRIQSGRRSPCTAASRPLAGLRSASCHEDYDIACSRGHPNFDRLSFRRPDHIRHHRPGWLATETALVEVGGRIWHRQRFFVLSAPVASDRLLVDECATVRDEVAKDGRLELGGDEGADSARRHPNCRSVGRGHADRKPELGLYRPGGGHFKLII